MIEDLSAGELPATAVLSEDDAHAIVTSFYREFGGREPDELGLNAFAARLRVDAPGATVPAMLHEFVRSPEAVVFRVGAAFSEAARIAGAGAHARPVVSLGTHCYTASLLKNAGLKTASYPFDWLFSSPAMIAHCLNDDFADLLNPRYYEPVPPARRRDGPDVNLCDHALFRDAYRVAFVFNHRDPTDPADYAYLTRCVERFRATAREPAVTFLLAVGAGDESPRGYESVSEALRRYAPSANLAYVAVARSEGRVVPERRLRAERDGHRLVQLVAGSRWHALAFENPLDDMAMLGEALGFS